MSHKLTINDKIGILDPEGLNLNPLTYQPYSQAYKDLAKIWSTYPTYKKANEVLKSITDNQLIFIVAGTGAGKSVIIPKIALHYTNYVGKIAMTLPKRLVTLSAATFSAKVSDITLGKEIGYVYKGSPKEMIGPENKIVYMTDGYMVMKFLRDPLLTEYNVVIIDEAHERSIRIDLLMLFLKNLLESGKRPDIRVIIMSATIDSSKYQKYFSKTKSTIVNISGMPNHEISVNFLPEPSKSYMNDGLELIEDLVQQGIRKDMLFFITTSSEALQLCGNIRPKYPKIFCIEVYSDMDKDLKIYAESRDKFLELGNYDQKLIMATNVAESSVTIDGLKYVIDSGYELYNYFNPEVYGKVLEKKLITKAQALQRRGRVGRTEPGICYHLMTKQQFDALENYPAPEILKQDITMDLLQIIQMTETQTFSDGYNLMQQLMDPPKKPYVNVARDIYVLYKIIDPNEKITKIGQNIIQFSSLSINRALFLIYAYQLHCAKEASIILAMAEKLSGKLSNLFYKADTICQSNCTRPASNELIQKLVQKKSDHLTYLKIFEEFKKSPDQRAWTKKYGIRMDLLNSVDKISRNYYYKIINIHKKPQPSRVTDIDIKKNIVEALESSHKHLIAMKMTPKFSKIIIEGKINKDSAILYNYKRKDLLNKKFIYDEITNINGTWEFNIVTIL
jgi:pre-mRNA-splicing factor ATP-dependent RNA helicase DHX15/PRP43